MMAFISRYVDAWYTLGNLGWNGGQKKKSTYIGSEKFDE
jgi:hypothetical protein